MEPTAREDILIIDAGDLDDTDLSPEEPIDDVVAEEERHERQELYVALTHPEDLDAERFGVRTRSKPRSSYQDGEYTSVGG